MTLTHLILLATTLSAPLIADENFLEPSVQNEVDHALSRAPTNTPPITLTGDFLGTNNLSTTAIAIKFVSSQTKDGHWFIGTNDVTAAVIPLLKSL